MTNTAAAPAHDGARDRQTQRRRPHPRPTRDAVLEVLRVARGPLTAPTIAAVLAPIRVGTVTGALSRLAIDGEVERVWRGSYMIRTAPQPGAPTGIDDAEVRRRVACYVADHPRCTWNALQRGVRGASHARKREALAWLVDRGAVRVSVTPGGLLAGPRRMRGLRTYNPTRHHSLARSWPAVLALLEAAPLLSPPRHLPRALSALLTTPAIDAGTAARERLDTKDDR